VRACARAEDDGLALSSAVLFGDFSFCPFVRDVMLFLGFPCLLRLNLCTLPLLLSFRYSPIPLLFPLLWLWLRRLESPIELFNILRISPLADMVDRYPFVFHPSPPFAYSYATLSYPPV
jgi:hypothetical protein